MIVLAKGSITKPDALAPHVNAEMRVVEELKAEGIMKAVYRRAAGPGVYLLLEGSSLNAIRDRVDTLPFVVEGLMTLDYEEIYEI
jgi:muconolactone delta-isomerase